MAETEKASELLSRMAETAGVSPDAYYAALQRVSGCERATRADFLALLHCAKTYGLDPLLKQIGLMMPTRDSTTPVIYVSVDGWLRCLTTHPDYLCWMHRDVWSGGAPGKGVIEAVTAVIYRKSWNAAGLPPFEHTEYLRECRRDTKPWNSHPARMLLERAIGQATRFCFGMYIPEAEEVEAIEPVATSGPISLVPAIRVESQVVPQPAAVAPEVIEARAEVVGVAAAARPAPVAARMPEFRPEESLKVDAALAGGKGDFDDLFS